MNAATHGMPRDQGLISKLAENTLETDLSLHTQHVTKPRLQVIHGSRIHRYWCFMTDSSYPHAMPVPSSITDPAHPEWTDLTQNGDWETKQDALLPLYGLSEQERIQLRDTHRYTILNMGRRTNADSEQVKAFAARVILQLGEILSAGAITLRATAYQTPASNSPLIACRFDMNTQESTEKARELYRQEPQVELTDTTSIEEIVRMLPQEALPHIEKIGPGNEKLRVYDASAFWRIACKTEYLWSEAQALLEADDVMADHMKLQKDHGGNSAPQPT